MQTSTRRFCAGTIEPSPAGSPDSTGASDARQAANTSCIYGCMPPVR